MAARGAALGGDSSEVPDVLEAGMDDGPFARSLRQSSPHAFSPKLAQSSKAPVFRGGSTYTEFWQLTMQQASERLTARPEDAGITRGLPDLADEQ